LYLLDASLSGGGDGAEVGDGLGAAVVLLRQARLVN
jgi:hypothetical protein